MNRLNLAFGFSFVGCLLAGTIGCSSSSSTPPPPPPPDPTVEGPITEPGAPFVAGTRGIILETVGYEQAEYFVSGTAASYTSAEELSSDGRWEVEEGETADYKTRALVYRPRDPRAFSGTVVVEWLNQASLSMVANLGGPLGRTHCPLTRGRRRSTSPWQI